MTRAFQIAYVDLDTPTAEQELAYYDRVIGATPTERGSDGRTYFSLGLDHHNITIKPASDKRLTALGLRIDQETADETLQSLRGLGLSPEKKSDARPGVPVLVEVAVAGHTLHLLPDMAMPGPGFRTSGVIPTRLGHVALMAPEADKLIKFCSAIGFRTTDWFEGIATFLTCNRDHHVLNIIAAPEARVHHLAFELRSRAAHHDAADFLATTGHPMLWGPTRHTAGHNLASYHYDPSRFLIELYSDMDVFVPELNIFEPRPWHEAFPQRPRVWTIDQLTTWGTRFEFDLKTA
jgi:Glyoxalase/Bleomycin resistance protein/Dioxygenase superfamily